MSPLDPLLLESYDYTLPSELIALYPIAPKQAAKLLVYRRATETITHTTFASLADYIPEDSLLVFNDTKVVKARFFGKRQSGGKVEFLYHKALDSKRFLVQIKGKVREKESIQLTQTIQATILRLHDHGFREVSLTHQTEGPLDLQALLLLLQEIGHPPLPPYIKRQETPEDLIEYQSVFAKHEGSIAAPTASLHFDTHDLEELQRRFDHTFITLHVGAGTFLGVETPSILEHTMHHEPFLITPASANKIQENPKILAIGTTAARTIEHHRRTLELQGECDLFLHPLNPPKTPLMLLTNFHLPKSTLLMLVSSIVGQEARVRIYQEAIAKNYRFFSYGDGMLIL